LLNCFLLNARFLIFKHKYIQTKPTIAAFLTTMNVVKSTEYFVAKHKGLLLKHNLKWNMPSCNI